MTITLPPELEQIVVQLAERQGTTPELLIESDLRQKYLPGQPDLSSSNGQSMADFFAGYIGSIDSSELAPNGSDLSEDTGRKFKELMLQKHLNSKR